MSVRPSIVTGNSSMQREPAAFLWDVHEATLRIREFVAGHDFNTYKGSYLVQSAVERQFEIIGEALNQLSKVAPELAAKVPDHKQIIAFRNILIHGYASLDQVIVWRVIQDHLPVLEQALAALLDAAEPPNPVS
jgi:uncharacterized protein with HEPN domain